MAAKQPPTRLVVSSAIAQELFQHALEGAPDEICGLLAGTGEHVTRLYRIPNIAASPATEYVMDPRAQVRALYEIEAEGMTLAAIYHSHPPGARAEPSATDLAKATWPGTPYVIVVPPEGGQPGQLRAFLLGPGGVQEIPVREA